MSGRPEWGRTVHQWQKWQKWYPTGVLIPVLPFLCLFALALLHPELPFRLLPQWGAHPSVNQLVGIFCIMMALTMLFEAFAAHVVTTGPAPAITILAGDRATFLRRGAVRFAGDMTGLLGIALLLAALAWLSFRSGSIAVTVLLIVPAAWLGAFVVPMVLRRYTPGGVWLTPAGLTDRFRGTEVTLAWDDVANAEFGALDFSVLFGGTPPVAFGGAPPVIVRTRRERPYTVRHLAGPCRNPRKPTINTVYLETRELGVNPSTLARVVLHYARNPAERHELGTEDSLATLAALHDDSGATRGYLPVVPDALQPRTP